MIATVNESGHKLGKIEAVRHNVREIAGSGTRGQPRARRREGNRTVASRVTGALLRAFIIAAVVAAPAIIVPGLSADGQQTVALIAVFAAILTYVEYRAEAPGLIEFRGAPPFNRMRVIILAAILLSLALIERGRGLPSALSDLFAAVGELVGQALDFPFSPVHLAVMALSDAATPADMAILRAAAGMALLVTLLGLFFFSFLMRQNWPRPGRVFNVWVNLPTFDPTSGPDIVTRLERDAAINLALGFLLPFLAPAVIHFAMGGLDPAIVSTPHGLIWLMAAWAFLPASLFMRGIAMLRVARMIRDKRRSGMPEGNTAAQPA